MSVTPDFIGQIYKDTNTGNLWRANSLTPGDWTLEVQNMQVKWLPSSSKLGQKLGLFTYGSIPGITQIINYATSNIAGFDFEVMDDLTTLSFPNLVSIDLLNSQGGYFTCTDCPVLLSCNLPVLQTVGGNFGCNSGTLLSSVDFGALKDVGGSMVCKLNPVLTSLDLSSLETVGGILDCKLNTLLSSVDISSITSISGMSVDFSGGALSTISVDGILSSLVGIAGWGAGKTVDLSGGTNSAPTSVGVGSDYAILVGRGAVVNVNP